MRMPALLIVALLFARVAAAQTAGQHPARAEEDALYAQRRAELRQALASQRQSARAAQREGPRKLSPQERKELRRQLRQQHPPQSLDRRPP